MGSGHTQLLRPTSKINLSSSGPHDQIESKGHIRSSRLAIFDMVSSSAKDIKKNEKYSEKDAYNTAVVRIAKQIRESKISDCSGGWKSIQDMRDLAFVVSLSPDTIKL